MTTKRADLLTKDPVAIDAMNRDAQITNQLAKNNAIVMVKTDRLTEAGTVTGDLVVATAWPEPADVKKLVDRAEKYKVTDAESFRIAAEAVVRLKKAQKEIKPFYKRFLDPIKSAVERITTPRDAAFNRVQTAIERYDSTALAWRRAENLRQERERQEAEAKARREAEEAQRLKAEELRRQAKATADRNMKQALRSEAATVMAMPPVVAPITPVPSRIPTVSNYSSRTYYSSKVVDFDALVDAVIAGTIPRAALLPNQTWLNQRATDDKDSFTVPGCELVKTDGSAAR